MFCNKCGKEIDNAATVCPYCNSAVQPIAQPIAQPEQCEQPQQPIYEAPAQPQATPIDGAYQPAQQYYQPQGQGAPMPNSTQTTQVATKKATDMKKVIIGAVAAVLAVIVVILIVTLGAGSPKKTANKVIKAYEDNDMKTAVEYSFPYDEKSLKYKFSQEYFDKYLKSMYYDDIQDYYDDLAEQYDYAGTIKDENDAFDAYIKYLEEENEDASKSTYEILDVKKYSKDSSKYKNTVDELDGIFDSEYFAFDTDYYNTKNVSGYAVVRVNITDEDGDTRKSNMEFVKFKGKWYSLSSYFDYFN